MIEVSILEYLNDEETTEKRTREEISRMRRNLKVKLIGKVVTSPAQQQIQH